GVGSQNKTALQTGSERSLRFAARLFSRVPAVFLPEICQRSATAVEDVAFGFDDIRYTLRIRRPWKFAAAIAAVLPHVPGTPWRCGSRLVAVICEPQPAIRQRRA